MAALAHYSTSGERRADLWVHGLGLLAALIAGPVLVAAAVAQGGVGLVSATLIYVVCLATMLGVSALYNLVRTPTVQQRLRRFDHAAIFLMIAGSYTPFTTQRFEGRWAVAMTAAVWIIALAAAAGKLFFAGISKRLWVLVYVALGWMVLVAIQPLVSGVRVSALVLLVSGGVIYTIGAVIYASPRLRFRRAIWHGFVLAAACTHYAAILTGVVLA